MTVAQLCLSAQKKPEDVGLGRIFRDDPRVWGEREEKPKQTNQKRKFCFKATAVGQGPVLLKTPERYTGCLPEISVIQSSGGSARSLLWWIKF